MKKILNSFLYALIIQSSLSTALHAEDVSALKPDELLLKVDKLANNFNDQTTLTTMIVDDGKTKREAKMETLIKGLQRRLVRFLLPTDAKGMMILMEDKNTMYVYMPQFQKVRRVASHAKQQGFMDSDFSQDDLASVYLSQDYTAAALDEKENNIRLKLTKRPGAEVAYDQLIVTIQKDTLWMTQIEYWLNGQAMRRQIRSQFKAITPQYSAPMLIVMEDLKKNHKTTLNLEDIKINTNLSESLFTKQNLERAR